MLNLYLFQEFVVFSKYLNVSKAADALFISQSNLSKHIKQLETELGFELVAKSGNHINLTNEGAHFLTGIQAILSDFDTLVNECQLIKNRAYTKIVLQDPPYQDKAGAVFYKLASALQMTSKAIDIDFAHEKFKDRIELLKRDDIHILIEYHCASIEHIRSRYESSGIRAIEISEEPLVVWGKRAVLETMNPLSIAQLRELSVMLSSDASSPMAPLVSELPLIVGYTPKIFVSPARSAAQYYYSGTERSVFLLPESCTTKEVFTSRDDMMFVPLANNELVCRGIALVNTKGSNYKLIEPILEEVANDRP